MFVCMCVCVLTITGLDPVKLKAHLMVSLNTHHCCASAGTLQAPKGKHHLALKAMSTLVGLCHTLPLSNTPTTYTPLPEMKILPVPVYITWHF